MVFPQSWEFLNTFVNMRVYGVLNKIQHTPNGIRVLEKGNDIIPLKNYRYLMNDFMDEWEHQSGGLINALIFSSSTSFMDDLPYIGSIILIHF